MAAYQAIGNQSAGAASVAVAWPAHVTGDLGILVIETGGEGTTLTPPSPWQSVTGSPRTDLATTAGSKLQVWWKFATSGAEANVNTGDSGDHQVARIITFRGVDPTTPFDVTSVTDAKTTASTTVTWPTITTATDNALVVLIATRPNDATSVTTFSNPVNANLTDLLERGEAGTNAGHGGGFVIVTGTKATAGAVGTTTMTSGTSTTNAEFVIALREEVLAPITGDLDATEAGADTFAATGDVHVKGSLAASETGADTFAATGSVASAAITGTLAATETGADTFAATGDVIVKGSLAATEAGADTLAATGKVLVRGSLAASETGADAFTSTGKVLVRGTLAATEAGADSFAATGKVIVKGALAASETGADTFASTGKVIVRGTLAASETAADSFAATGDVIVQGAMAATETGADLFFGNGTSQITSAGTLAATETGNDTASATGQVLVRGTLAATEAGADTFASTGQVVVIGALAASESGADAFAADGQVLVRGALAASETGTDTFESTGTVLVRGSLGATETGADIFVGGGGAPIMGLLDATETGADSFSASGAITNPPRTGTLAATEAADTFGGYAAGYVQPGYVGGVNGTVGTVFAITGAQAQLLRRIHALHGLGPAPLVVGSSSRTAGDVTQTITQAGQAVSITTTAASDTFTGSIGQMIEELAALHGLSGPLVVTPTSRTAGAIVQALSTVGTTTTVTRQ